jgi:preprotein translocase subunit SecB
MKSSVLRLEKYWLKSITCSENPAFDPNSTGVPVYQTYTSRGQKADDRKVWKVDLQIRTSEKIEPFQPYNIVVEMSGIFEVPDTPPEMDWETIVAVNGPAVLFGAARELVAFVTGRGLFPAAILPSVTFIDEAPPREVPKSNTGPEKKA